MALPFEGIFGNNCELRVMEFLLPLKGMEFNISELAEEAGVSRPTANRVIKKFVEHGVMKVAQKRGGTSYYEINPESPFVKLFEDLNNIVIEQMLGEEMLYRIHEAMQGIAPAKSQMERKPEIASEPMIYRLDIYKWPYLREGEHYQASPEKGPIAFQGGGINGAG